ncbi:hypothetical protein JXA34_00885 [Patescibacteria group bacterium]|nr:hypothetical protein [Patescibacteria group bacterium]
MSTLTALPLENDISSQEVGENPIEKYQFIYHFLPHPHYKKRASLLSHHAFVLYCGLMIVFMGAFKIVPKFFPGVLGYASDITVNELFKLTNEKRVGAGYRELRLSPALSRAAEKKAVNMFEKDYWAHVAPDGTEPWSFVLAEDYDYLYAGENLAKNFYTSEDVVEAWLNSPSHRDNLLSSNYDEIGFAVVNGVLEGYETTLVVQFFGKSRFPAQKASVATEEALLEEYETANTYSPTPQVEAKQVEYPATNTEVLPLVDVSYAAKGISISIAVFVSLLLIADIWYSKKKGILKLNGHTLSHLILLIAVIISVWFVLQPGVIL